MPVFYEKLVLQPSAYVRKILDFLDIPFNESVLHHQVPETDGDTEPLKMRPSGYIFDNSLATDVLRPQP